MANAFTESSLVSRGLGLPSRMTRFPQLARATSGAGGGAGMVLRVEPIATCLDQLLAERPRKQQLAAETKVSEARADLQLGVIKGATDACS